MDLGAAANAASRQPEKDGEASVDSRKRCFVGPADDRTDSFATRGLRLVDLDLRHPLQPGLKTDSDAQKRCLDGVTGNRQHGD